MSSTAKHIITLIAGALLASAATLFLDRHIGHHPGPETVVKTVVDTLVIRDTIRITQPVPVTVRVRDTIRVPVTVPGKTDTVWAQLPREEKIYQDSTFRAVVSGVMPSLDTIDVYRKTTTVTITNTVQLPAPRLSWGVQAGVGVTTSGSVMPYLGVGVQYRLGKKGHQK